MARFFIDRPIFAWVIAIITMFLGALAIRSLPVAQYPEIAPPQVSVSGVYPGASAQIVENSVTQIIEQNLSGLDGFRYMSSTSSSQGTFNVTVTFNQGVNVDIAQVQVQNKIQTALTTLPQEVQRQGVTVEKSSDSLFMVASFYDENDQYTAGDIGDFVNVNIKDPLSRIEGIGTIQFFGSGYAMRVWIDPFLLAKYNLTPLDISQAIQEQNAQVAFGQIGGAPANPNQQINYTITAQTQLETPEEFEQIQLRVNEDGSQVRLKDVARVELSDESSNFSVSYNNRPATALGISLASGANALDTAAKVKAEIESLKSTLPEGVNVAYPYDTTPFVELSISQVIDTLVEAVFLVFIIMYLFLGNFRATLIPTFAIPVVLLGTFGLLSVFGFTINTLTLFAMILAIGLLVDDAIVVVENVERIMEEEKLEPVEATKKSMDEITGALVGIVIVLSVVFLPMAFLSGASGVIYRQFSITIITTMSLSILCAMIFTPALCATLLKSPHSKTEPKGIAKFFATISSPITKVINYIVLKFNKGFDRVNNGYEKTSRFAVTKPKRFLIVFAVILGFIYLGFSRLPSSFLPDEDQGIIIGITIGPNGTPLNVTSDLLNDITTHVLESEKDSVDAILSVGGFSFAGAGGNNGIFFMKLKPWDERLYGRMDRLMAYFKKEPLADLSATGVQQRLQGYLSSLQTATGFAIVPPPIIGLGSGSGVDFVLQNSSSLSHNQFMGSVLGFMGALAQASNNPESSVKGTPRPGSQFDSPQLHVDIDQEKARALQITVANINSSLATGFASQYVNDFIDRGRVKRVIIQGDTDFRMQPSDFNKWYVRNNIGEMVPFSAFGSYNWTYGSPQLNRFDGYSSFPLTAEAKEGFSTGALMDEIEKVVKENFPGVSVEWTNSSYEEKQTGNAQFYLYAISIFVVFLSLAALYESWSIPFAVLLTMPMGIIGAIVGAYLFDGINNDVYFQVGLLTTLGLTSKNAILIIEFAKDLTHKGTNIIDATVQACHMRLRPILMTSLAFGFGVLPMALSTGAGSGAQNVVGITVVSGMIGGTLLVLLFAPIFFVLIEKKDAEKGKL